MPDWQIWRYWSVCKYGDINLSDFTCVQSRRRDRVYCANDAVEVLLWLVCVGIVVILLRADGRIGVSVVMTVSFEMRSLWWVWSA